jgi:hypothetical protein
MVRLAGIPATIKPTLQDMPSTLSQLVMAVEIGQQRPSSQDCQEARASGHNRLLGFDEGMTVFSVVRAIIVGLAGILKFATLSFLRAVRWLWDRAHLI